MRDKLHLEELDSFVRLARIIQSGECVLFLGAGVSLDSGAPSGKKLAEELSQDFFPGEPVTTDLLAVSEAIDANFSRKELNSWLENRFKSLEPKGALVSIPKYHWRSIYTVNFDMLLEAAYADDTRHVQELHPFYSDRDPISRLKENQVALYKLHGCLSRANSKEGRLVLTQDDMHTVEESRQRFFNRLLDDVSDYTIFYVGFARNDPDFRRVIIDVQRAAGELTDIRRSYALQPSPLPSLVVTWEQKKVTLIDATAGDFFKALDSSLGRESRYVAVAPSPARKLPPIMERFRKVTEAIFTDVRRNFEIIDESIGAQEPNTKEFFSGAQPNWGLISAAIDAQRDLRDDLMGAVLRDRHLDRSGPQAVLVHAEAGSGKTTLLRRLAVDLTLTWQQVVVALKPFGNLDFLALERLVAATDERVFVIVDDASSVARELAELLLSARRAKTRVTIISGARTNEWREIKEDYDLDSVEEYELLPLSRGEIDRVISTLTDHDALGFLAGMSPEAKVGAFERRANKQLLVALREATEGKNFDEIIVDEYNRIPSPEGQRAYLLVASLHRFNIITRAGLLHRALNLPLKQLGSRVLEPTEKIIIPQVPFGEHDIYYTTRHPLIAEIVFDRTIRNDRRRLEFYEDLIKNLDLGYSSDLDAYRKLTRGKNKLLLRDFRAPQSRRELMNQLLQRDRNDAFAYQHAAMMELDNHDLKAAARYLDQAITLAPHEPSIRDTEGRLSLLAAAAEKSPVLAEELFARTEEIFKRNIQRRTDEPYGYRHLAETYLKWSDRKDSDEERLRYVRLAYEALLNGLSRCSSKSMLLQLQAEIEQDILKNPENARRIFAQILETKPGDLITRFLASSLEEREGDPEQALLILRDGVNESPYGPQLHYRVAILMAEQDFGSESEIRSHFEAALLGPIRDIRPRQAYGAYLFSIGAYDEYAKQFAHLDRMPLSRKELQDISRFEFPGLSGRHSGRVVRFAFSAGAVDYDRGAIEIYFPTRHLKKGLRDKLSIGYTVSFEIGFNARGAVALDLRAQEPPRPSSPMLEQQMTLPTTDGALEE